MIQLPEVQKSRKVVWQVGAQMNSTHQAKDGLPADFFPAVMPIYTGHYHLPHLVGVQHNIRYVGSPFEGRKRFKRMV